MPLVGTLCCQTGKPADFEYCLGCARGEGPATCQHPLPLIKFMANKEKSREGIGLSATGILACARQNILLTDHEYYEDPDNFMAAFQGEVMHEGFEKWLADEDAIVSEVRLEKEVEVEVAPGVLVTVVLSGKPDQVYPARKLITDQKNISRPVACNKPGSTESNQQWCERMRLKEPYPEHEAQVNIYAWLYRGGKVISENRWFPLGTEVNVEIESGGIIYNGNDKRSRKYPIRIWSHEEQDAFVRERAAYRAKYAYDGELPPLLPVEKIIKSRKTGKRVVKRNFKCNYCPVRELCDNLATRDRSVSPNEPEYWDIDTIEAGELMDADSPTGAEWTER